MPVKIETNIENAFMKKRQRKFHQVNKSILRVCLIDSQYLLHLTLSSENNWQLQPYVCDTNGLVNRRTDGQ